MKKKTQFILYQFWGTCTCFNSEDEVDLDPLAGNTEAQDPAPQSKQGGKKKKNKKKDDWYEISIP